MQGYAMNLSHLFKVIALTSILLIPHVSEADDTKTQDYYKINRVLQYAQNELKSEYLELDSSLINHRRKAIEVWLLEDGKRKSQLNILAENRVTLPIFSEAEAKRHQLFFTAADKDIYIFLNLRFTQLPKRIGYDDLFAALDDYNAVKAIMNGPPSWLTPDFDTLWLIFELPSSLTIKGDTVERILASNGKDIMLKKDPKIMGSGAYLVFESLPATVLALN
jgi:hypothetical protein